MPLIKTYTPSPILLTRLKSLRQSASKPLYVVITDNIYRRISSHLNGYGSSDIYEYNHNKLSIAFFQEDNVLYRDIYESYLIYRFNPRYNISKTAKHKR